MINLFSIWIGFNVFIRVAIQEKVTKLFPERLL